VFRDTAILGVGKRGRGRGGGGGRGDPSTLLFRAGEKRYRRKEKKGKNWGSSSNPRVVPATSKREEKKEGKRGGPLLTRL